MRVGLAYGPELEVVSPFTLRSQSPLGYLGRAVADVRGDRTQCAVAVTRLFPLPGSRDVWRRDVIGERAVTPAEDDVTRDGWPFFALATTSDAWGASYAFFSFLEWGGVAVASGPAQLIQARAASWRALWRTGFPDAAGTAETLVEILGG